MKKTQEKSKAGTKPGAKATKTRLIRAQTASREQEKQKSPDRKSPAKPQEKQGQAQAQSQKALAPHPTRLDDPHARANKFLPSSPRARYWEKTFFDVLSRTANITISARSAGIDRTTVYDRRDRSPKFAAKLKACIDEAVDLLEASAWSRAVQGVERGVWSKDKDGNPVRVETIHEHSDRLHEVLLRGWRPERYSPKIQQEISGPGGVPFAPIIAPTTVIFAIPDNGRLPKQITQEIPAQAQALPAPKQEPAPEQPTARTDTKLPAQPEKGMPAQTHLSPEPQAMTEQERKAQAESDRIDRANEEAMRRIRAEGRDNEPKGGQHYPFRGHLNTNTR